MLIFQRIENGSGMLKYLFRSDYGVVDSLERVLLKEYKTSYSVIFRS